MGISRIIMEGVLGLCLTDATERLVWGYRQRRASDRQLACKTEVSADAPEKGRLAFPWHPILPTQIGSVRGDGDDTQQYSRALWFCCSSGWGLIHVRTTT